MDEVDMAVQFLFTVAACNQDVDNRPKNNPSVADIHTYTLQTLIRDAAKTGRDAGNSYTDWELVNWNITLSQDFCKCYFWLVPRDTLSSNIVSW